MKYKYTTDNTDPKTSQTAVIADDKNNPVITLKTGTNKIRVITLKNNKYIDETATMFTYIINEKKETNEIILNKKRGNLISNFTGSEATWDVGMMVADDYGYYYFASFGYDENEGYSFVSIVKTNDFSKPEGQYLNMQIILHFGANTALNHGQIIDGYMYSNYFKPI